MLWYTNDPYEQLLLFPWNDSPPNNSLDLDSTVARLLRALKKLLHSTQQNQLHKDV